MKAIQFFKTVGLYMVENGVEYYRYTYVRNSEKECSYRVGDDFITRYESDDPHQTAISNEAKQKLLAARSDFVNIQCGILKNDGTFHLAKGDHYLVAYRKELRKDCKGEKYLYVNEERQDFYRFVIFLGNGKVLQYLCKVEDLLERFDFTTLARGSFSRDSEQKNLEEVKKERLPLYLSAERHDRYLYLALKYLAEIAIQEEADEATAIDGKSRFVRENKVYGEGVEISNVEQIPLSYFNRTERYACTVRIGARNWHATWYPQRHRLYIWQYVEFQNRARAEIEISDEVYESLRKQAVKKYSGTRK